MRFVYIFWIITLPPPPKKKKIEGNTNPYLYNFFLNIKKVKEMRLKAYMFWTQMVAQKYMYLC